MKRVLIPVLLAGIAAAIVAFAGSWILSILTGIVVLTIALVVSRSIERQGHDPSRRSFLLGTAGLGVLLTGAGSLAGRGLRKLTLPDPTPVMDEMAATAGSEYMEILMRTHRPGRSGELQLMLAPYNSSNYANESESLKPDDPRTSHASVWMYLQRIPLAVYAPGFVAGGSSTERVTLADIAPTMASLMGFSEWSALHREGRPLPGITASPKPPRVIVVFVIDGGGWNVLHQWPDAWPFLKELHSKSMLYRNAIHGSFPAVTACAHATIGTGTFPRDHGITGHNIRVGDRIRKTYGPPGRAMPSDILLPTLSDLWSQKTDNRAWVGEIGYQIWHLGMLGYGREPGSSERPVAIYFDEMHTHEFQPHNPAYFRMPSQSPPIRIFEGYWDKYWTEPGHPSPDPNDPVGRQVPCCSPPIIRYQGDIIEDTLKYEPIGRTGTTDLLYVNYKSPDYTGHVYNMLDHHEEIVLLEVDAQLRRLVGQLEDQYGDDFALVVTADHGQCPLPDAVNGVRLDPIQLQDAIAGNFGGSPVNVVQYVAPSEVFLSHAALWDAGVNPSDIGAFLQNYRYENNLGWYVPEDAREENLLAKLEFTGVFGQDYLDTLVGKDLSRFGPTKTRSSDPYGVAPAEW